MDRPKAKLIRVEPDSKGRRYFDTYFYECVECGREFIRHQRNDRINPYCCVCNKKYQRERQAANKEIRMAKHDAEVRAEVVNKLIADINEQNYCMLEKCPLYSECRRYSCPINGRGEDILIAWLKEIGED